MAANTKCKSGKEPRAKAGDSECDLGAAITPDGSCGHATKLPVKKGQLEADGGKA